MSKKVWDSTVPLQPVETSGGGKIVQDFFGLHDTKSFEKAPVTALAAGSKAQSYVDETERQRLNLGKSFPGRLSKVKIRHLTAYIASHPDHGLCLYVDQKTSRPPSDVEIFINGAKDRLVVDTHSFFDRLTNEQVADSLITSLCSNYERKHVLMISD